MNIRGDSSLGNNLVLSSALILTQHDLELDLELELGDVSLPL